MEPLFSLITVVKNDVTGLKATAESILMQNHRNFEWLIVDGYSSDGSWELAQEVASLPGIRTLQSPPVGIYAAMNVGARMSHADWLWFINAGDVLLTEDILERITSAVENNESASVIATPVVYLTTTSHYFSLSLPRIMVTASGSYAFFHHQGSILSSTHFKNIGGFDETFKFAADGKLLDLMIKQSDPVIFPYVSVGFEMGGATSKNFRKSLAEIRVYRHLAMTNKEIINYQIKEFLRGLLLRLIDKPLVKYFLHFYMVRREISVIRQANLAGLYIPSKKDRHE